MATALAGINRPSATSAGPSRARRVGLIVALAGLVLVTIAFFGNLSASTASEPAATSAWTFGLTTAGFGAIKLGIAIVLVGIIAKLWARVGSLREALPHLRADSNTAPQLGEFTSAQGKGVATATVPKDLPIHKMARTMWAPMLAMGAMAVLAGFFVSLAWSGNATGGESVTTAAAWTQGLQFLGEAFLLAGISFLLGSILGLIREGGAETQESLGVVVKVLKMPTTAKLFVGLMATGLMLAVFQFIAYLVVAANGTAVAANFAWLGPIRELSLGLLLSGIVLALATIATALGFQASRVREIITTGR